MKTLELRKASKTLADYAANLGAESIVITSNKKPVAALVSLKDADRESLSLSLNPAFLRITRRGRAEVKRGEVCSWSRSSERCLSEPTHLTRHRSGRRKSGAAVDAERQPDKGTGPVHQPAG